MRVAIKHGVHGRGVKGRRPAPAGPGHTLLPPCAEPRSPAGKLSYRVGAALDTPSRLPGLCSLGCLVEGALSTCSPAAPSCISGAGSSVAVHLGEMLPRGPRAGLGCSCLGLLLRSAACLRPCLGEVCRRHLSVGLAPRPTPRSQNRAGGSIQVEAKPPPEAREPGPGARGPASSGPSVCEHMGPREHACTRRCRCVCGAHVCASAYGGTEAHEARA